MKLIFLILFSFFVIISCKDKTDGQSGESNESSLQSRIDYIEDNFYGTASVFFVCGDFLLQYYYETDWPQHVLRYRFYIRDFFSRINKTDSLRAKYGLKKDEGVNYDGDTFETWHEFDHWDYLTIIDENNKEIHLYYIIFKETKRHGTIIEPNDRILYFSPLKQTVKLDNGYFSKAIVPKMDISLPDTIKYAKYGLEYYTSLGTKRSKNILLGIETLFIFPEHLSVDYITFSRAGLDTLLKDIDKELSKTNIPRIYRLK